MFIMQHLFYNFNEFRTGNNSDCYRLICMKKRVRNFTILFVFGGQGARPDDQLLLEAGCKLCQPLDSHNVVLIVYCKVFYT